MLLYLPAFRIGRNNNINNFLLTTERANTFDVMKMILLLLFWCKFYFDTRKDRERKAGYSKFENLSTVFKNDGGKVWKKKFESKFFRLVRLFDVMEFCKKISWNIKK